MIKPSPQGDLQVLLEQVGSRWILDSGHHNSKLDHDTGPVAEAVRQDTEIEKTAETTLKGKYQIETGLDDGRQVQAGSIYGHGESATDQPALLQKQRHLSKLGRR